jgi:hypothetical protein
MNFRKLDSVSNVHDFRLLVQVAGRHKKICRLALAKKDASLFLIPYGTKGTYFWGHGTFREGEQRATFSHADLAGTQEPLKLSIHESGQVHVKTLHGEAYKAGPLQTIPLWEYRGQHLATISIDSLESLEDAGPLKPKRKSPEVVLDVKEIGDSRRFVLYANGETTPFSVPLKAVVRMRRLGLPAPLQIGLAVLNQSPLVPPGELGGVSIISGWDPRKQDLLVEEQLLWVRAL